MRYCFAIVLIIIGLNVNAQSNHPKDTMINGVSFHYVEKMPQASYDYKLYIARNLHYPDSAVAHNIEGKVVVKFCVNEDGSISNCQVIHGIDKDCDAEATRVLMSMPAWDPGWQNGKPVKVFFTLPVLFKLTD